MMITEQLARQETTTRLVEAITQDHFVLYGQPIVSMGHAEKQFDYLEVLVRYVEEERNYLHPGGFIEVLESLNLMSVLDRWVINRVIRSMVVHYTAQKNWNVPRYSLNLSVDSLYESEFGGLVGEYFRRHSLPPGKLSFEIPEPDAHVHETELQKLIAKLRPLGCCFTLTSYTGNFLPPASLHALGVSNVKIDGQLIAEMHHNVEASARIKAIHIMCAKMGIWTIAEMVELPGTIEKLKKIGVHYAQGYAVAIPTPLQCSTNAVT